MSRAPRIELAGEVYHVINRANGRQRIFQTTKDYELFEQILTDAVDDISNSPTSPQLVCRSD